MKTAQPPTVSQRTFWIVVAALVAMQVGQFLYLSRSSSSEPLDSSRHEIHESIRTRSLSIVTPENRTMMSLSADSIEQQVAGGPVVRGYTSSFRMDRFNDPRAAITFEVTPLHGPTFHMVHPRSGSVMGFSCLEDDTISLYFGPNRDDNWRECRIEALCGKRQLRIVDAAKRPFVVIDAGVAPGAQPKITIRSDEAQPIQIEKHPKK